MNQRYFIYDCLGLICGNHKGYDTYKGANIAVSKIKMKLWERFDLIKKHKPEMTLIYSIKLTPVISIL